MEPECLLVRVGEQALKSDYVQKRFFDILLSNIHSGLRGIKYEIKTERNRILIYTKQTKKTIKILKRIFGITSISPAWVCNSNLKDMSLLSAKIAKKVLKLNKKRSFAIRARRTGSHKFTSQNIAEQAGKAVISKTNAKVNLSKPNKEIFIDCRQNEAYVFTKKIAGPGGLPLGTGGKLLSIVYDLESTTATWFMMKRGVEIIILTNKKTKFLNVLKKWYIGKKLKIFKTDLKNLKEIAENEKVQAIVLANFIENKLLRKIEAKKLLILRPLIGFNERQLKNYCKKFTRYDE